MRHHVSIRPFLIDASLELMLALAFGSPKGNTSPTYTAPCKSNTFTWSKFLIFFSGDAQPVDGDSGLVIRDMFGKIEVMEFKHEEPWFHVLDKFVVESKDNQRYILPVRVLPNRVIAVAMADGSVMLIELENRRTSRINQGE